MDIHALSKLNQYFDNLETHDFAVAFSGGVDSTVLLKLAVDHASMSHGKVYAITVNNTLNPLEEIEEARRTAVSLGAQFVALPVDVLQDAGIKQNSIDRCYLCKKRILSCILSFAKEHGITTTMEGTNQSDLSVFRPGQKALKELPVISPLTDCGVTKEDVRMIAADFSLPQADKPSMPCMATRFPYGTSLDPSLFPAIYEAEQFLRDLGCLNVRIRIHGQLARIETDVFCQSIVMEHRGEIIEHVKKTGVSFITLDLEGFCSGSMDKNINQK